MRLTDARSKTTVTDRPLGTQVFRLLDAMAYSPESHKGHKMYVRGLLIKLPGEQRMTISSSRDDRAELRELMNGVTVRLMPDITYSCCVLAFAVVGAAQSTDSTTTVWQGVYTEAQAARGQSEYTTHCANCHRDDLSGYNDILKGRRFMEKNRESSLHLFFDKTKTTMPRGAPATLSDKAYVDIVSYVLKVERISGRRRRSFASRICRRFRSSGKTDRSRCRTFRSCGSSDV